MCSRHTGPNCTIAGTGQTGTLLTNDCGVSLLLSASDASDLTQLDRKTQATKAAMSRQPFQTP